MTVLVTGGAGFVGANLCVALAGRDSSREIVAFDNLKRPGRVYPIAALNELSYEENETRFELTDDQTHPGVSSRGIAEEFPLHGARTLYGATKLGGELLIQEYAAAFGVPAVIDRCGVIAG